jgi:hypothetical protein
MNDFYERYTTFLNLINDQSCDFLKENLICKLV